MRIDVLCALVVCAHAVAAAAAAAGRDQFDQAPSLGKSVPPIDPTMRLTDYGLSGVGLGPVCAAFARATCCTREHTEAILRTIVPYERAGMSAPCKAMTERLRCLMCHPDVGTLGTAPVACARQCTAWLHACEDDYFAPAPVGAARLPLPCHDGALLCSRAGDMFANGAAFCDAMGVRWTDEPTCMDGTAPADRRGTPVKLPKQRSVHEHWLEVILQAMQLERLAPALSALLPGQAAAVVPVAALVFVGSLYAALKLGRQLRAGGADDDFKPAANARKRAG